MHRPTHRRVTPLYGLLPAILLLAGACEREEALEDPDTLDDRSAMAAPDQAEPGAPHEHAHHGGKGKKIDRLCEALACTADQRVRIEGVAERLWSERPGPKGDRRAANAALAQAFGDAGFSSDALRAYHAAVGPDEEEIEALMAEAVVELHGVLTAEQRATLAEKIAERGLPLVGGHGPKRGGEGPDEGRGARLTERLCAAVTCTEAQAAEIGRLVQARPERSAVPQAEREALAAAFRGEALADEPVHAYLDAVAKARVQDREAMEASVVALHGVLTPEQRAALAAQVAEDGPRALGLGGKHGKGRHGKGGKHGKGKRGEGRRGEGERGGPGGEAHFG